MSSTYAIYLKTMSIGFKYLTLHLIVRNVQSAGDWFGVGLAYPKIIKIKLAGSIVQDHKVDIGELGRFLTNFQDLIESFMLVQHPDVKLAKDLKASSKIYLKRITKGSAILNLQGSGQKALLGGNPVMEAYGAAVSMVHGININPVAARVDLNNQFVLPNLRLKTEIKLNTMFTGRYEIGFGFDSRFIKPKSSMGSHISKWINEDIKKGTSEIQGVMTGIEVDEPHYLTITTAAGQKIKCLYDKSEEDKIINDYLKKPITIKGAITGGIKSVRVKEILDIKSWTYSLLSEVGKFRFKNPIKLSVDFEDDDVWCLKIESLNCYGCGYSYKEALKNLEISISEKIEDYVMKFKESELTEKAKVLRKNLSEIHLGD